LFLDKLAELSNSSLRPISNRTLSEALGWEQSKYQRVRAELLQGARIFPAKGFGGSVKLAALPTKKALNLFVSYCHADEIVKTELLKHLEPLRRLQLIETWHDRQIKAGEDWGNKISVNLERADIIVLVVSIDFINSKYCYDIELDRALERHTAREAVIIPLIARSCMWHTAPFSKIQAVPKDGKPLALWPNLDDALSAVAESIRETAVGILGE
jgi:hypothetical protein